MNIGLIGYGKMGRDIFALLFDKLADADITVLEIYGAEENTAAVIKIPVSEPVEARSKRCLTRRCKDFYTVIMRFLGSAAATEHGHEAAAVFRSVRIRIDTARS